MAMTNPRIRNAWPIALSLLLACGGDDGGGDMANGGDSGSGVQGGGAGAPSAPSAPSAASDVGCELGELHVQGTLDGRSVDERATSSQHSFRNKFDEELGHLEVTAEDLSLQLYFDRLLPNGASAPARGSFASASVDAGNCETEYPGTLTLDDDGEGATFVLTELRAPPYCTGAPVSGMLEGCFKYPEFGF
jgi:hypothetical protein